MLVDNTDLIKEHVGGVHKDLTFSTFKPFIQNGEYQVAQLLGPEVMTALSEQPMEGAMADLLRQAQRTISLVGWQESMIGTLYQMGNAGLAKFLTKDMAKLTMWELDTMLLEAARRADQGIEQLMTFLRDREEELPIWTGSAAYADLNRQLIPGTDILQEALPEVVASYRLWASLKLYFPKVERRAIAGVTGPATLAALKAKLAEGVTLTPAEKELWMYCRNYLAILALKEALRFIRVKFTAAGIQIESSFKGLKDGKAVSDDQVNELEEQLIKRAEEARGELKNFLNQTATATVFPEYFHSTLYVAPGSNEWKLPDNEGKKHFWM